MAGLKQIKTKIRAVQKTEQVTKAMEAVSAAKMRKAQTRAIAGRGYARAAAAILARLAGSKDLMNHSLVAPRAVQRALYVIITSDKGLAGALNSAVLRSALAAMQTEGLSPAQVSVIAIGKKAGDFFTARGFEVEAVCPNTDETIQGGVQEIVASILNRFIAGEVDLVRVCYQNFVSTFEQRPTLRTLLPLSLEELEAVVQDIIPARGMFSAPEKSASPTTYSFEPTESEVLDVILPRLAAIFIYHALLESQASEHSARMVAMKSASDKAVELTKALKVRFNKARQAAITREVSEITGGMEALA